MAFPTIFNPALRHSARIPALRPAVGVAVLAAAGIALAGCSHHNSRQERAAQVASASITSIGVNSYLWRASLETLSFMPLTQADSSGGVIVTDWYSNPKNPNERVKVSVSILDRDLRADALRVAASREVMVNGAWVAAPVQAATVQKLEDVILTKARDLRRSDIG
jgi:hypothetical protein